MRHAIGQSEPLLNNLFKPLLNPYKPLESPPDASKPKTKPKGRVGKQAFLDFDFLAENNSLNPGSKINVLRANKSFGRDLAALSQNFVSWILYAYSPLGVRIKDPVSLAVKRLNGENPNSNAGGDFAKLAKLPPFALRSLFDMDMAGKELDDSLEAHIYLVNYRDLEKPYKQQLYRRLFGDS